MSLYLKNASYIDWQTFEITKTDILVTDTGISLASAPDEDADIIDCRGRYVTKSFGCGHHHIYSTLARGMPAPKKIPTNFKEILTYIWWTIDKLLDRDMIEASALASAMYCAKNGVTFVIDHHASPYAIEGSLDIIADAFDKVGISHLLCYELSDRDGAEIADKGLEEHDRFLSKRQGHVGLHASFTVGDELLERAINLAKKHSTGIHIHTAEAKADQDECVKKYGKSVVERLNDAGALDLHQSIFIHCVHLDSVEKNIIRQKGSYIAENIESNQNNNVGFADYGSITKNVMLGTDGMHSDMLRSAKAAFLAGQATEGISMPDAYSRFRNVHKYIERSGFSGDGENNLVILDYDSPTELTQDNFLGHFIYGIDSRHVDTVISNGKLIVQDKQLLTADEAEITAFAREMGKKLWAEMEKA